MVCCVFCAIIVNKEAYKAQPAKSAELLAGHFHDNHYYGVSTMTHASVSNNENQDNGELKFSDICIYNYFAIEVLELVGISMPTQDELDLVEGKLKVLVRLKGIRKNSKKALTPTPKKGRYCHV